MDCRVIADDFTGSGDTGIQFLATGLPVCVRMVVDDAALSFSSPAQTPSLLPGGHVVVLDTETRNAKPETARQRARQAGLLCASGNTLLYKKTDSTLRGNIAVELATLQAQRGGPVIFAPTFAASGRIVEKGQLLVHGVPVHKSPMASDPQAPVRTADLQELLASGAGLESVQIHPRNLPPQWKNLLHSDICLCCDAASQEDLEILVDAVLTELTPEKVLWAGSAGLAAALMTRLFSAAGPIPQAQPSAPGNRPALTSALAVVGSVHPANREQVRHAATAQALCIVSPDMQRLKSHAADETQRLHHSLRMALEAGQDAVLQSAPHEDCVDRNSSLQVADMLGQLAAELAAEVPLRGIFVTGGEAAVHMLRHMHCTQVCVEAEAEPGIPRLRLKDGLCPELTIISKAGGFGSPSTLSHCLRLL